MLVVVLAALGMAHQGVGVPDLVPMPDRVEMGGGGLVISADTHVLIERGDLEPLAEVVAGEIELVTGIRPGLGIIVPEDPLPARSIILALGETGEDDYRLGINSSAAVVTGEGVASIARGTSTLVQAIQRDGTRWVVPGMQVHDRPDSEYRAVSIDVARSPHSIAVLKDAIRLARQYRLSYIQLHLTDDQHFTYPFPGVTDKLEGNFAYTREQLIDLVAYADARGVTLIPELDLPGHSTRLMQSGYLNPGQNHADVADPANFDRIFAIIDDMCGVFESSPYFHIGGDESGAGEKLVPFVAAVNRHLRSRWPEKRLIVWEGFHGSPTDQIPATGDDRVIVMSWESGYNPPWNLLRAGYEVINCSWKPLYIVGGGRRRYPHIAQRNWSPELIYEWQKNDFWHWQPGQPVFEDQGPRDPDLSDGRWDAGYIDRRHQVLGGSLLAWEQLEHSLIDDLRWRIPVVAERLWNPETGQSWTQFERRMKAADERAMTIVQPIEIITPPVAPGDPVAADFVRMRSADPPIEFRRRTPLPGVIRTSFKSVERDELGQPVFPEPAAPTTASPAQQEFYYEPAGGWVKAQFFRADGSPLEGVAQARYAWMPERVRVTYYSVDRRPANSVPNFDAFAADRVELRTMFSGIRGPYKLEKVKGMRFDAQFFAPENGEYTFEIQTLDGRADLFVNGERIIRNSPSDQKPVTSTIRLSKGSHDFRIDHMAGAILPILMVTVEGPGIEGKRDVSHYLRAEAWPM